MLLKNIDNPYTIRLTIGENPPPTDRVMLTDHITLGLRLHVAERIVLLLTYVPNRSKNTAVDRLHSDRQPNQTAKYN